jgi:branched-subunit amino acid ABC-type transport system permease component
MLGLQFVSGLETAAILFLLAAGLSIIYGVCHVLNLAHGSFFLLAIFLAISTEKILPTDGAFWWALLLVPLVLALFGACLEVLVFRRLYRFDILVQTLPTVALVYILSDLTKMIWGVAPQSMAMPEILSAPVELMGAFIPGYYIFVVIAGAVTAISVWLLVYRSEWGLLLRATSVDRETAQALGVNSDWIFTTVFALSFALCGLAGVLIAPLSGANPGTELDSTVDAFAVVVIGGLGSIWGALLAAILIGMVKAFGILLLPQFAMGFVFALMAVVLILRPKGLLGARLS